jgi:type IV secretion system protein VirB10
MGIMESLRGRIKGQPPAEDGLPDMSASSPVLADLMQAARGNTAIGTGKPSERTGLITDENEGLPSVNRRKGGNKLVTVLGFVFILGAGIAMAVAVNGDGSGKDKTKKKASPEREEQVSNKLPPLVMPPAPQPLRVTSPVTAARAHPDRKSVV